MSDGFLSRWSKRKAEQQQNQLPTMAPAAPPAALVAAQPVESTVEEEIADTEVVTPAGPSDAEIQAAMAGEAPMPADIIAELPSIESLNKDSDFSLFMQEGVPEDLKRQALAKLWISDPIFTSPEVYDLHMEDYNFPTTPKIIKTAWNFGKDAVSAVTEKLEQLEDTQPESDHIDTTVSVDTAEQQPSQAEDDKQGG